MTPLVLAFVIGVIPQAAGPLRVPEFEAPTRSPSPTSDAQRALLREGIALYSRGDLDGAEARYQRILNDDPEHSYTRYELAVVIQARREYQRAIDMAAPLTAYEGADLALTYALIGSVLDMAGEPERAVEVYRKGLEFTTERHVALYLNMAVTQAQSLDDVAGAKASLKSGALADPSHASTQLMLAKLFLRDDLQSIGLLAIGRFLILEPASPRLQEAYSMWHGVLTRSVSPNGRGGAAVAVNPEKPTDEGDMFTLDTFISLSRIEAQAVTPPLTQIEAMVHQVDRLVDVYGSTDPGDDAGTFLWTYYMPYFKAMRDAGHVEAFVYYISQRTNFPGVAEWLPANRERVGAFLAWSRGYQWPAAE